MKQERLARLSLDRVADSLDASGKTIKDATDIATLYANVYKWNIFHIDAHTFPQYGIFLIKQ
jgi:head-tail adaptor